MINKKIIVAVDVNEISKAKTLVNELLPYAAGFKVGLEILTSEGSPAVISAMPKGAPIFFDAKFSDIPNTVAGAMRGVVKHGAWMTTIHTMGGLEMMRVAKEASLAEALKLGRTPPLVMGVTVLTSLNAESLTRIGIPTDDGRVSDAVVKLALLAKEAGLDGVISSPKEIEAIRKECGSNFLIVTPGIRPAWAATNDQKRVMTPREAIDAGANFLVIGRPVTNPPVEIGSPANAIQKIMEECA